MQKTRYFIWYLSEKNYWLWRLHKKPDIFSSYQNFVFWSGTYPWVSLLMSKNNHLFKLLRLNLKFWQWKLMGTSWKITFVDVLISVYPKSFQYAFPENLPSKRLIKKKDSHIYQSSTLAFSKWNLEKNSRVRL